MEAWLHDWLSLLLRWAHFITGVAWIGASFYFNWLENHLQRRDAATAEAAGGAGAQSPDPIGGDLWAVHGGGFYYLQKYRVAPERLPETLHWFKFEAYFTWITGFALLCVVYYWNAAIYLVGAGESSPGPLAAIGLGIGSLLASWVFYHVLCKGFAARNPRATALAVFAWFSALAWLLGEFLSGRAAYIHVGAAIGTVMVANVFFVIIPAQKELVAALREQRPPDPAPGLEALQRSRHNNYLTLPVLFIMISNHYPATYGNPKAVAILMLLGVAGVGIRHYFNVRHEPGRGRLTLAASLVLLALTALLTLPRGGVASAGAGPAPSTADLAPMVAARCGACHAGQPAFPGIAAAPLGIVLGGAADLERLADRIHQVAVSARTMPPGNVTGMTEDERMTLDRWYAARTEESKQETTR
ncbi:urate hydroxylase PuuD [Elongatibacter sediminis]|uniref:Urate hydroxylase PuuD n=1 Tax=Elongatibacter sediminis TaxID=3119006 RepID=A0AAW9RIV8_9GAMM